MIQGVQVLPAVQQVSCRHACQHSRTRLGHNCAAQERWDSAYSTALLLKQQLLGLKLIIQAGS